MSRYVVLIYADRYGVTETVRDNRLYAITVASNPGPALESLQAYWPVKLELVHAIEAGNRTDDLERTLHIKFRAQRAPYGAFWFILKGSDVELIKSITGANLTRVSGMLKRQLAPPPEPVIATKDLPDFIAEQLEKCENLLSK